MTKYLKRVLIFAFLYFLTSIGIQKFLPFYYANAQLNSKFIEYEKVRQEVNTVFFGNSQVNRHIVPSEFDKATNYKTNSFNLASDATPFLEQSYLVENALKKLPAKNYFLVVFKSADIHKSNLYKPRTSYYHDFKRFFLSMKLTNGDLLQKKYHLIAFVMKLGNSILNLFKPAIYDDYALSKQTKKGFIAYDQEAILRNEKIDTVADRQYFEAIIPKKQTLKYNTEMNMDSKENIIIDEYKRLIVIATKLNKQLYFLFMPNDQNYKHYNLPNTIYMGDGEDFPEFYDVNNYFNATHLNGNGAIHFTRRLATVYLETSLTNQN